METLPASSAQEAEMIDTDFIERRHEPRRRALKAARILIDKKSVISCHVRNISDHGVKLALDSIVGVPDEFVLDIAGELPRQARIVWKTYTEAGVALR
jgi:hypothetical protein